MARIRSVKPELRTSLVVADWPREVRYFFVLLWGYLDDHGRGVDDARLIKADCLPLDDDVTRHVVDEWVDLIAKSGPLCRYEADGKRYLHIASWSEHQRPSHPAASRVPPCPIHDSSGVSPEDLAKPSGGAREDLRNQSTGPVDNESSQAKPPREALARSSGDTPESLVPEQGAGSREQVVRAGSREQGSREKPRATNDTRIPDDFAVTPKMRAWYRENALDVDITLETAQFIDHWQSKSGKDAIKSDWTAAWRTWMRNAQKWKNERASNGRRPPSGGHEPYRDKPTRDYHGEL